MFLDRDGLKGRARALIPADPKSYKHLPYVIELDDEVVRTRDNGLMISLEVTGIDDIAAVRRVIEEEGYTVTDGTTGTSKSGCCSGNR